MLDWHSCQICFEIKILLLLSIARTEQLSLAHRYLSYMYNNIGIKNDFPFINIRKVLREGVKTEGQARGFHYLSRDLANVNE